jgi:hypothetical protein
MQAINNRFYFASRDTMLEFNPSNNALRVMASLRRNPPVVPEDRLPNYGQPKFLKGAGGLILALFASSVHPWNPASGVWSESFAGGPGIFGGGRLSPGQDALLYWEGQPYEDRKVRRFTARATDELLFELKKESFTVPGMRPRTRATEVPRWKAPADLNSLHLVTALDGTNVWGLGWSQRTLTWFDQQWEEPVTVRVQFEPKALTNESPLISQLQLTPIPAGLVVHTRLAEGFWMIPQKDLQDALAKNSPLRETARAISPAIGRTITTSSTNAEFNWADETMPDAAKIVRTYMREGAKGLGMGELITAIRREPALEPYLMLTRDFQSTLLLIGPYDTNGTGGIETPELDAMIKERKPRLTHQDLLVRFDANRDGKLESEEIKLAIMEERVRLQSALNTLGAPPVKVALINFTAENSDNEGILASIHLSEVIQKNLTSQNGVVWLPRSEVQAAEREAKAAGFSGTVAALRCGRRLQADWVIVGRFSRSADKG